MAPHRLSSVALLGVCLCVCSGVSPVRLTDLHSSKTFDGIGAISGGGATSRLLYDYPNEARSTILDALFTPKLIAGFQGIKVEVPGDADTTCGSEVSHRHNAADGGSATRGYEGWILSEAQKRNPSINTSALQWAAPRFVGEGKETLFTATGIDYVVDWIVGLRTHWNVSLQWMGCGWNEHSYSPDHCVAMRKRLDAVGLSAVRLAAADEWYPPHCWQVAYDMASNATIRAAIDAISMHVAGVLEHTDPTPAVALQFPVWQGEEHIGLPDPDAVPAWEWAAAMSVAIEINQNWVLNNMSSTVYWPISYSWYSGLSYRGKGFVVATSPWGTAPFSIPFGAWIVAHTTHFTDAATWSLLNRTGSGYAPGSTGRNVSYVTYVSHAVNPIANARDVTIVIETGFQGPYQSSTAAAFHQSSSGAAAAAPSPTTITFQLADGLLGWATLHVWHTNTTSTFLREADVAVAVNGTFSVTIEPSAIITVTSVESAHEGGEAVMRRMRARSFVTAATGLESAPSVGTSSSSANINSIKGAYTAPSSSVALSDGPLDDVFPLPYADDFERYGNDSLPLFMSDMFGAFTTCAVDADSAAARFPGNAPFHVDNTAAARLSEAADGLLSDAAATAAGLRAGEIGAAAGLRRDTYIACGDDDALLRPGRCQLTPSPSHLRTGGNGYVLRQWVDEAPIGVYCCVVVDNNGFVMRGSDIVNTCIIFCCVVCRSM